MTTDAAHTTELPDTAAWPRRIAAALAGWMGLMIAITVVLEPAPTVMVIGPEAGVLAAIRSTDVSIVDARPGFAVVTSDTPGFVRELYAAGAWLVLPRRLGGCMSRRS